MNQFGTVLQFAEGTTREEIVAALKTIKHLLDPKTLVRNEYGRNADGSMKVTQRPITNKEMVHEFNPDHGTPVWYIP